MNSEAPESSISAPIPHKPCLQLHTPPTPWLLGGSDQWISQYAFSQHQPCCQDSSVVPQGDTHLLSPGFLLMCFWAERWVTSLGGDAIQPHGKGALQVMEMAVCNHLLSRDNSCVDFSTHTPTLSSLALASWSI